jgi:mono/diheme cytochrome c family protein
MKKIKIIFFFLICMASTFACYGQLETVKYDEGRSDPIFQQKCSNCHEFDEGGMLLMDQKVWKDTILRMSKKQGADIAKSDIEQLVSAHVKREKAERESFLEECTRCHEAGKSLSAIKTRQAWEETIRRMMTKAKREVSDDKIKMLISYHVRYQDDIMRKCSKCHDLKRVVTLQRDEETWQKTVAAMCKKKGADICKDEINIIARYHIQRQKKGREFFEKKCSGCHTRMSLRAPTEVEKTPDQWRATIRRMMAKTNEAMSDKEIDILIYYHVRAHAAIISERLETQSEILGLASAELFQKKCSGCHSLERPLRTLKDEESWRKTIQIMAKKEGSGITESDVAELVNFHMTRQRKERELFLRDCSQCHPVDVALQTGKTIEQWRATAKIMMNKGGKKVTNAELDILTRYHIRYEKSLADLAINACSRCHDPERTLTPSATGNDWERVIVEMSEKEGSGITYDDVRRLVQYHVAKQEIGQQVFKKDCSECHEPEETLKKKKSRDEWRQTIRRMMAKSSKMITDQEVDILINYHIARTR